MNHYKFFVIGGGSGGIAAARRAAGYGATVGLAECNKLGGTCVNVGCVPKKIMWYAASVEETLRNAHHYGYSLDNLKFSWEKLKKARDKSVKKLNSIYSTNLEKAGVVLHKFAASLIGFDKQKFRLQVGPNEVTADHVLIATGGYPTPMNIKGMEFCLTSDSFFALDHQPKSVAVIGAGYIAVELASIFTLLRSETHLLTRGTHALRKFDVMLSMALRDEMISQGCIMHPEVEVVSVEKDMNSKLLSIQTKDDKSIKNLEAVLVAVGRSPLLKNLHLKAIGDLKYTRSGHIQVDDYQNTSVERLYALGDVCGKVELTPMAIAAGRRLADRLFGGIKDAKADYDYVPSVVFTHPCIATIGVTEDEAKKIHGSENIRIYYSKHVCLYYNIFEQLPENQKKPEVQMKLVCLKSDDDRIIGMHIIGMGADEMLQGFAVAIKMGAKKKDLDKCVAIHPTVAEEMVTLHPWSLPLNGL